MQCMEIHDRIEYHNNRCLESKISAQPRTTLCIQFLDRENNEKNNTLPLGKQICFLEQYVAVQKFCQFISNEVYWQTCFSTLKKNTE